MVCPARSAAFFTTSCPIHPHQIPISPSSGRVSPELRSGNKTSERVETTRPRYGAFRHFLPFFLLLPASDSAIATACFSGYPSLRSFLMFSPTVLSLEPFFNGMSLPLCHTHGLTNGLLPLGVCHNDEVLPRLRRYQLPGHLWHVHDLLVVLVPLE